jgi:hypothetical protein
MNRNQSTVCPECKVDVEHSPKAEHAEACSFYMRNWEQETGKSIRLSKDGMGYDYTNQAWISSFRYQSCGHEGAQRDTCDCYGTLHAGELAIPQRMLPAGFYAVYSNPSFFDQADLIVDRIMGAYKTGGEK